MSDPDADRRRRSPAEWITLAVASIALATVVAVAASRIPHDDPPDPVATISGPVEQRGDGWHVPVEVHNRGDDTASAVQVAVTLTFEDESLEADQVIDFLSGGDDEHLAFVFGRDPAGGDILVRVTGYAVP